MPPHLLRPRGLFAEGFRAHRRARHNRPAVSGARVRSGAGGRELARGVGTRRTVRGVDISPPVRRCRTLPYAGARRSPRDVRRKLGAQTFVVRRRARGETGPRGGGREGPPPARARAAPRAPPTPLPPSPCLESPAPRNPLPRTGSAAAMRQSISRSRSMSARPTNLGTPLGRRGHVTNLRRT